VFLELLVAIGRLAMALRWIDGPAAGDALSLVWQAEDPGRGGDGEGTKQGGEKPWLPAPQYLEHPLYAVFRLRPTARFTGRSNPGLNRYSGSVRRAGTASSAGCLYEYRSPRKFRSTTSSSPHDST
jgi:hypothetical protein